MNDFDIYGKDEVWAYPDKIGVGDCEDYVLEKRRQLQAGEGPVARPTCSSPSSASRTARATRC
jgi:hypothetical protein